MRLAFGLILVLWYVWVLYITRREKRSFRSWLFEKLLVFRLDKRIFISSDNPEEYLATRAAANEEPYQFPDPLKLLCDVTRIDVAGIDCVQLKHRNTGGTLVLYFHGGAYVEQPLVAHWLFLDQVIRLSQCEVLVPIYPKAPVHTALECMNMLIDLYRMLLEKHEPDSIVFMGDSAGGGLSLALSQMLRDIGLPQPSMQILLSPWLDVSMENPGMDLLESKDPMLQRHFLKVVGAAWAGELDVRDPRVSPLHGTFEGIATVILYVGTHELFLADARRFKLRCVARGISCDYREFPKMNHVFPVFPIPEAKIVQHEIACMLKTRAYCNVDKDTSLQ